VWIGNVLREAREARGWSLEEVSERTKIKRRYIQAMEEGSFDVLPGRVYVKGFLRSYAKLLGLSPEELIAGFEKQYMVEDLAPIPEVIGGRKNLSWQSRRPRFVVYALLVVIVGLLMVFGIRLSGKEAGFYKDMSLKQEQDGNSAVSKTSPGGDSREKPVVPEANPAPGQSKGVDFAHQGVDLMLTVTRESCWMRVVVDGEVKYVGELAARQSRSFQAGERIEVKLGNAGAVQVRLNGRDLGYIGKRGEVVEKEFLAPANG